MIVNKYNQGGGGSGSGMTPQQVQQQIDTSLNPYWDSGETKDYVDEAVSGISLEGYYTSAQTKTYVDSADTIIYASAVTYTDNAVSGLASEDYVDSGNTRVYASAVSYTDQAVSGLASEAYVQEALADIDLSGYYTSGETDDAISEALAPYYTSAQTDEKIASADTIIYGSAVTYVDNAVSGLATEEYVVNQISDIEEMIPDGTILKAVEEFPEDPEMGDVVSKLMPADIASWNTSDDTTAKMHIDTDILNALDTGETYTIAEFPSVDGTIELVAKVQPSRSNVPAWCLYEYVGGEEGSIICQLTSTDEESTAYEIPNNMRGPVPVAYYTSVNYLEDDFSEKEGMMIQIGRITDPSDPTTWTGSYSEISGLELYPIGGGHVVDGTYIYDGTEWKNTKEKNPTAQILKSIGCDNEDWTDNIIYESGLTEGDIFSIRVKDGDKEDWLYGWAECDICGGEWMSFENHDENRRYYSITQTFHREDQENPWRNFSIWFDDTNVFSGGNTYHMYYDYDNQVMVLDKVRENQDDPGPELYLGGDYDNEVLYEEDGDEYLVFSAGNDDFDAECGENSIHISNINCLMDASNEGPWYFTKADNLTYVEYDDWKYPYYPVPYIVNGGEPERIVTSTYLDETIQNNYLTSYTPTTGFSTINGSAITQGGNIKIEGGSTPDMSAYYTSAQTEDAISAALTPYYTSAQTTAILEEAGIIEYDSSTSSTTINSLTELGQKLETAERVTSLALNELHDDLGTISAATAGKADATALTAYTPTTGFSTINGSAITTGGDIVIEGGGADLSAYYTSAQTEEAISAATAGKADAQNVQSPGQLTWLPGWNSQGVITGTTKRLYETVFSVNGAEGKRIMNTNGSSFPSIYAPTTSGNPGDVLVSTGNGAPVWSAVTIPDMSEYYTSAQTNTAISAATQNMVTSTTITTMWRGSQAEYDTLTNSGATADPNTFYIILPSA